MDWIFLVFCLLILCHLRGRPLVFNADYLSKENTNALRGVMAITIVLHHLAEHSSTGRLFPVLQHAGYLVVAVFFLLSGYGLTLKFMHKGREYLDSIWRKRILFFIIVLLLDTAVYVVFNLFNGKHYDCSQIALSFVNGNTIAGSAWYLFALLYFYVFYWVSFRWIQSRNLAMGCVTLLILLCDALWYLAGYSSFWIFSNLAFPVGILWALGKGRIDIWLGRARNYWLALIGCVALFALFSLLPAVCKLLYSYLMCRCVSAPVFAILTVLLLGRLRFVGKLWQLVNIVSLEVFLLHALVYRFLRSNIVMVRNDVLWTLLTLGGTIAVAIPAHWLNTAIKKLLK